MSVWTCPECRSGQHHHDRYPDGSDAGCPASPDTITPCACREVVHEGTDWRARAHAAEAERDEWKSRRDRAVEECRFLHQEGMSRRDHHLKHCGAARAAQEAEAERDRLAGEVETLRARLESARTRVHDLSAWANAAAAATPCTCSAQRERAEAAEAERDVLRARLAAVERGKAALRDFADRLNRAADSLRTKARDAEHEGMDFDSARLRGKTEGVRLAWSYVEEYLRGDQ